MIENNATSEAATTTESAVAPVTNLRETKRQMAAAKKAHPTAAKKAPAKKAAPVADKPARKTPAASGGVKLRWTAIGDDDARTGRITATAGDTTYSVLPSGDKWKATKKADGKTTVIIDQVGRVRAYQAAVKLHHTGEMPAAKKATA